RAVKPTFRPLTRHRLLPGRTGHRGAWDRYSHDRRVHHQRARTLSRSSWGGRGGAEANTASWRVLEKSGYARVWAARLASDDPTDAGPAFVYRRVLIRARAHSELPAGLFLLTDRTAMLGPMGLARPLDACSLPASLCAVPTVPSKRTASGPISRFFL